MATDCIKVLKVSRNEVDIFLSGVGRRPLIAAFCKDDGSEIFQEAHNLAQALVPDYDEIEVKDFHRWERRGKHTEILEQILTAMEPYHTNYFFYCVAAFEDPIQYSTVPLAVGAGWNQRQRQRAIAVALALSANRLAPLWACSQYKELCKEVQVASSALMNTESKQHGSKGCSKSEEVKIKGCGIEGKGSSKSDSLSDLFQYAGIQEGRRVAFDEHISEEITLQTMNEGFARAPRGRSGSRGRSISAGSRRVSGSRGRSDSRDSRGHSCGRRRSLSPLLSSQADVGIGISVDPLNVRFTHADISGHFHNGNALDKTIKSVINGQLQAEHISAASPPELVLHPSGKVYSLSNRRLFVYRVLRTLGECTSMHAKIYRFDDERVQSKKVDTRSQKVMSKWDRAFTTTNDGHTVNVRNGSEFSESQGSASLTFRWSPVSDD